MAERNGKYANESKAVIISFRQSRSDGNSFYGHSIERNPKFSLKIYLQTKSDFKICSKNHFDWSISESPYWGPNYGRNYFQAYKTFDTNGIGKFTFNLDFLNKFLQKIPKFKLFILIFFLLKIIYPYYI